MMSPARNRRKAFVAAASLAFVTVPFSSAHATEASASGEGELPRLPSPGPSCGSEQIRCDQATVTPGQHYLDLAVSGGGHSEGGGSGEGGGGRPRCVFEPLVEGDHSYYYFRLREDPNIPPEAQFFWLDCGDYRHLRWFVPGETDPVADGMLTELVQEAFDRIHLGRPAMLIAPSLEGYQLTGLPTWLAIDPEAFTTLTGSVSTGGLTVEAWVEPSEVVWDTGTGETEICNTAGNLYNPARPYRDQKPWCSYTYTHTPAHLTGDPDSTTYALSATVIYDASYRITGHGFDHSYQLGPLDGPTVTADVEVREMRAIACVDIACSNVTDE